MLATTMVVVVMVLTITMVIMGMIMIVVMVMMRMMLTTTMVMMGMAMVVIMMMNVHPLSTICVSKVASFRSRQGTVLRYSELCLIAFHCLCLCFIQKKVGESVITVSSLSLETYTCEAENGLFDGDGNLIVARADIRITDNGKRAAEYYHQILLFLFSVCSRVSCSVTSFVFNLCSRVNYRIVAVGGISLTSLHLVYRGPLCMGSPDLRVKKAKKTA